MLIQGFYEESMNCKIHYFKVIFKDDFPHKIPILRGENMNRRTKRIGEAVVYIGDEVQNKDTGDIAAELSYGAIRDIMNQLCDYEDAHEDGYVISPTKLTELTEINKLLNWSRVTDITKRLAELDRLATEIEIVSGYNLEKILELFLAGYTLEAPNYKAEYRGEINGRLI